MAHTRKKTPAKPTPGDQTAPKPTRGPAKGQQTHKGGAPKGNRNAIRHGLKCAVLPKDAKYIETRLNEFRRTLEDAVLAVKGEIGLVDAAMINTAVKWERHGCLAGRWLNKRADELKPTDLLTFSREIAKASTERDRAIAQLGLDRDEEEDVFDVMYKQLPAPEGEQT